MATGYSKPENHRVREKFNGYCWEANGQEFLRFQVVWRDGSYIKLLTDAFLGYQPTQYCSNQTNMISAINNFNQKIYFTGLKIAFKDFLYSELSFS